MAWTQSDIDALKAAIAKGVRTVAYADRTVSYNTPQEMIAVLAMMEAEVSQSTAGRSTVASFGRG